MDAKQTLAVTAEGERDLIISRRFDAPRHWIFDAWTKPELLKRWFGPEGWLVTSSTIELKPGGTYHHRMRHSSGREMGMHGVYRTIDPPTHLVATEIWDDMDVGESLVTSDFSEEHEHTQLRVQVRYPSAEVRDTMLNGPMKRGLFESFDKLDRLLDWMWTEHS